MYILINKKLYKKNIIYKCINFNVYNIIDFFFFHLPVFYTRDLNAHVCIGIYSVAVFCLC